jgi:hypothetical protein
LAHPAPQERLKMMTRSMIALSLGFAGVILATQATQAAPQCGARETVVTTLAERYGETRRSMGVAANNAVMEVFASTDSGTWTITVTTPNGMMCLVASGEGYEAMADELPAKGEKA